MSEIILTLVSDNNEEVQVLHNTENTVLETLLKNGSVRGGFCRGISVCGRCRIRFLRGVPLPTAADRAAFTPKELRDGLRLACRARPLSDAAAVLLMEAEQEMDIITEPADQGRGRKEALTGRLLACADIGTSTIAMQLWDTGRKAPLSGFGVMNPQRGFGLDVVSRIRAAKEHGQEMRQALLDALGTGIKHMQREAGLTQKPELLCIAANMAMVHLLMGYDTSGLGESPFRPVNRELIREKFFGVDTIILPALSAFVGGDIVAGIYDTDLWRAQAPGLLVDLGTNGEMVLGCAGRLYAAAAAAGPAFEGAADGGIYASDMLCLTAKLLRKGLVDETGWLAGARGGSYVDLDGVRVTQTRIRELQLAKAAVSAGVRCLAGHYGLHDASELHRVYLAGGFGYYVNAGDAAALGLLPQESARRTAAVGNSSLSGARKLGVLFLLGQEDTALTQLSGIRNMTRALNLAEDPSFSDHYLENMNLTPCVW